MCFIPSITYTNYMRTNIVRSCCFRLEGQHVLVLIRIYLRRRSENALAAQILGQMEALFTLVSRYHVALFEVLDTMDKLL